jgi:hypothetical protein
MRLVDITGMNIWTVVLLVRQYASLLSGYHYRGKYHLHLQGRSKSRWNVVKVYQKGGQWEQGKSRTLQRQLTRKALTRAPINDGPVKAMILAKVNGNECLVLKQRETAIFHSFGVQMKGFQ